MKKILLCALLVVAIAPTASADSLMLASGATTTTFSGGGNTSASATINGWDLLIAFGATNSPGITPFGLDLLVLATCSTGACLTSPLHVLVSDTGFTVPVPAGGFQTSYSATVTGTGTTIEVAWAASSNALFTLGLANKIGPPVFVVPSVGPFSSPGGFGFFVGGPGETGPYSLTIEEVFNANGSAASFSADANVFATPEPGTLTLFGAGLTSIAGLIRRKLKK